MKPHLLTALLASLLFAAMNGFAQTPANKPLAGAKSSQDPVPGLIVRVHLGNAQDPKADATHLLCVLQDGDEWFDNYKPKAADELRGVTTSAELNYFAFGYIVVDKETEVVFEIRDGVCKVNNKEFGQGTFRHTFKKGKYPIEIFRQYGHSQPTFKVVGANGEQVLFHTREMLTRELNRSVKVERKTFKSKMIGETPKF